MHIIRKSDIHNFNAFAIIHPLLVLNILYKREKRITKRRLCKVKVYTKCKIEDQCSLPYPQALYLELEQQEIAAPHH